MKHALFFIIVLTGAVLLLSGDTPTQDVSRETEPTFGAFGDPFLSLQLATTSLTDGYILQTDGTDSTWVDPSTVSVSSASSTLLSDSNYWSGGNVFTSATTTSFAITSITSALPLAAADGSFQEYAGDTCTSQFVRALNGAGVATCATVDISADTNLAATYPITLTGDTLSFPATSTIFSDLADSVLTNIGGTVTASSTLGLNRIPTCATITGSADLCDGADSEGSAAWPFTPSSAYGTSTSASSTPFQLWSGLIASSTSHFENSTTTLSTLETLWVTTLDTITTLGATAEATIEAAIDTLANLTSIQGLTVTLADAGADAILGWDDTASAYENLTVAEVVAVISGTIDFSDLAGGVAAGQYDAASIDGDDVNSNIAGRSLTLTSAAPDTLDADAELYTDSKTFNYASSTLATSTLPVATWEVPQAATISTITCWSHQTDAGTTTVQFEERTLPNTAGTDVLYSPGIVAGSGVPTASSTIANAGLAAGSYLSLIIEGYFEGVTPTKPTCDVKFIYDD